MSDKVLRHRAICDELNALYEKKNRDYGDSFHLSFCEEGMAMARIRLGDKLNRFKQLTRNPDSQSVNDESIRDTLIDLANYAIMTVLELDHEDNIPDDEAAVRYRGEIARRTNGKPDVTVFKFRGNECHLFRDGDKFALNECGCLICDVCAYEDRDPDEYPCEVCYHGDGEREYFKLDERKVEIIK
jgi:hypothetical protein